MTTQSLDLNLIPKGIFPRLYVSQYDKGQTWTFNIYAGNTAYTIPNGATVTIQGTKPDKTGFQYSCTASGNVVTATEQQQMTVIAGEVSAEIRITNNNEIIATLNFILVVEPAALTDETEISETDLPIIEQAIEMFPHYQEMIDDVSSEIATLSNREQERWGTVNLFDKDIMADVQIIELSYKTLYMKPNTTYTVSTDLPQNLDNFANIFVYNSSGVPDTNANGVWNGQTRTFTTNSDGIINVAYRTKEFTNTSTKWFLNHNFQIEEGNIATAFQPYAAPNVTLTQDTKGLPQDMNGLTDNQFENGAVNLLHCDATSNVQTGLTYIVEDDGTVKVSGTNTSNETAQIAVTISYVDWDSTKRYKISGCPSNGSSSSYRLGLTINKSNGWSRTLTELGDGLEFQLASNETKIKVSINISAGYAISGTLTFKPMITVADMPNSDYAHYVPYAKSNKELTHLIKKKTATVTTSGNGNASIATDLVPYSAQILAINVTSGAENGAIAVAYKNLGASVNGLHVWAPDGTSLASTQIGIEVIYIDGADVT